MYCSSQLDLSSSSFIQQLSSSLNSVQSLQLCQYFLLYRCSTQRLYLSLSPDSSSHVLRVHDANQYASHPQFETLQTFHYLRYWIIFTIVFTKFFSKQVFISSSYLFSKVYAIPFTPRHQFFAILFHLEFLWLWLLLSRL